MEDAELEPLHARMGAVGPAPWDTLGQQDMGYVMDAGVEKKNRSSSTGAPGDGLDSIRQPFLGWALPPFRRSYPPRMAPR